VHEIKNAVSEQNSEILLENIAIRQANVLVIYWPKVWNEN